MKETFSVLFFIKKNEVKRNGLATIMIRITINGQQVQFSSKLDILPDLWNQKENRALDSKVPTLSVNNRLVAIRDDIKRHYDDLSLKLQYVSVHRLKQAFLAQEDEMMLTYQFKEQVKIFRTKSGRAITALTADIYKLTLRRLIEFMEKTYKISDILIYKVDLLFLEKFYLFLKKEYKCKNNTAVKYMKRLAAVMNFSERIGILQVNPFNLFRFHIEKKYPVYLTEDEVRLIQNKVFLTTRLEKIRDAFLFCCYTGLSFTDLCLLRTSDIEYSNGHYWLIIIRKKTDIISQIPLLDIPLELINKYCPEYNTKPNNRTIFSLCSNQKTNEYLKEIADVCGIKKHLTFHVSRHTFSTMALNNGVSLEALGRMLGHSSIRTTQWYANITNQKLVREMDRMRDRINICK